MQCWQQQHNNNNKGMVNMMSPQPPPPVAMSLRTRESSSMALKHIFDQINNSGSSLAAATTTGARGGEDPKWSQGQHIGGMRNQLNLPDLDLRKRLPDLDLSFRAPAGQENSPAIAAQTGFGSPISTPTATNHNLTQATLPSWCLMNGQLQQSFVPQAAASTRANPSSRQSTAQLTIFYSGNVNVYDDVPADKAHAIMLLAGNSWTSNFRSPAPPILEKERASSPVCAGASPARPPPRPNVITIANNVASSASRGFSSAAPSPSLASPPPSPALTTAPLEGKPAGAAKRPHAGIELPHARKASLARFLEKRKDRVQVQQVNPEVPEKGTGEPSSRPSSPTSSSSSKKQCTAAGQSRSPSDPSKSKAQIEQDKPCYINEHRFFD